MAKLKALEEFGKAFIPEKVRPNLRKYLLKAGITDVPYDVFGALFVLSLVVTGIATVVFIIPFIDKLKLNLLLYFLSIFGTWVVLNLALAVLFMSVVYFYFDMKIYHRTKEMEAVLIEFLQFVSENLKGGMSFDKALWSSVKPRFKVLASEIRIAAKKAMTGEDVEDALIEFTEKYDSATLKRSFSLIVEGMRGGGQMAELIDKVVDNLKETRELKEDMAATALSYVIFISFIVMVIAPGLFALSKQLLIILGSFAEKLGSSLSGANTISLPIDFKTIAVTPHDFTIFSQSALAVISGFSAMIISIIKDGNVKDGIKYVPFFILVSLILYNVIAKGLEYLMGSLFTV